MGGLLEARVACGALLGEELVVKFSVITKSFICSSFVFFAAYASFSDFKYVSFDQSMGNRRMQWGQFYRQDKQWHSQLRSNFEAYNPARIADQEVVPIPKIIHQIWLGSPFPVRYEKWAASWKQHHPDWQYMLWTDENVGSLILENRELFEQATNFGVKADILRYELLNQFGGLYIDTDFECLRPFDVLHETYSFFTGISNESSFVLANGLLASVPGHPIIRACIQNVTVAQDSYWENISRGSGPLFFTPECMNFVSQGNKGFMALPRSYFYPMPLGVPAKAKPEIYIRPESFAIHHWEGAWT